MQFLKNYLLPRIFQFFVVIFIGTTVVFIIPRLTPTDPVERQLEIITVRGMYLDSESIADIKQTLKELYGLEGSFTDQYFIFWRRLFKGDFGPSFSQFPTPVTTLIANSMPWTVGLLLISTLLSWAVGSLLGVFAGAFRQARWTKIMGVFAMTIRPIPYYIMALALVILFSYLIPIFPMLGGFSGGRITGLSFKVIFDLIKHAFLPALSLVLIGFGTWFLQMRSVTSNIVSEDYVTYAEVQGLPKGKIIFQYIARNAILPQITGLALSLGFIFGGALITEQVFSYPGIGSLLFNAINGSDYNVIMGIVIFSIISIATTVLIIDLIYPLFDPRVRYR